MPSTPTEPPAYFTGPGLLEGIRAYTSNILGQCVFGLVIGTQAAQHGLSLPEAFSMSMLVYAGLSQAVSLQAWPETISAASLVALAVATATINLRFFLLGVTMRPWLGTLPAWKAYPMLFLMTDGGVLQALRYRAAGGADASFYLGPSLLLYLSWGVATVIGYLGAAAIGDPRTFGLDLVIPGFFAALLVPAWKGAWRAVPWLVAGLVAAAVQMSVQGYWFIVAGAFAGVLTAGLMRDDTGDAEKAAAERAS